MERKSQTQKVVDHLLATGSVNNFWAMENYILRLAAVIHDLRKDGWEFGGHYGEGHNEKNWYYDVVHNPHENKK